MDSNHKCACERRNRIRLSVAAYAYELHDDSILSDAEFDKLAYSINPDQDTWSDQVCYMKPSCPSCARRVTRSKKIDKFFRTEFVPYSGSWIQKHPDLEGVAEAYRRNRSVL